MHICSYQLAMLVHGNAVLAVLTGLVSIWCCSSLPVKVSEVSSYTRLRSWNQSTLYSIETDAGYLANPLLLHLVGSRYDMGYAYGYLLSEEVAASYSSLMSSLLSSNDSEGLESVIGLALDWQWNDYLSKELPAIYQRELMGVSDGAAANGCKECGAYVTRGITLANAPGDVKDFLLILIREFLRHTDQAKPELSKMMSLLSPAAGDGMQCSMFAVWGSRTLNGDLYSARNLDWNKDTGINKYKIVVVTVPDDGAVASASVGFAGLYGTLAGMSAAGLTVHEANLEEDKISFLGFPWVLRLRYIMEFAKDLSTARQLWAATNNTVGFNHMVASAPDAKLYQQKKTKTVALAMETMYQYTAYFADNDTREATATYTPPSEGASPVHIGSPLGEAVWRTNHGYDPVIRKQYEWSQSPKADSLVRYMIIHDALVDYHTRKIPIGIDEALNMTAIVGNKGMEHPYQCLDNNDGTNVLSVTFKPASLTLYSAWEKSSGSAWRPAVCSNYIELNMSKWFTV